MNKKSDNRVVESSKKLVFDEYHLAASYFTNVVKMNRKISFPVPVGPELCWAYLHALDNCKLPRGKRFDKYRGKDIDVQYSKISHYFRIAAATVAGKQGG